MGIHAYNQVFLLVLVAVTVGLRCSHTHWHAADIDHCVPLWHADYFEDLNRLSAASGAFAATQCAFKDAAFSSYYAALFRTLESSNCGEANVLICGC